jgi:hypothetical protein
MLPHIWKQPAFRSKLAILMSAFLVTAPLSTLYVLGSENGGLVQLREQFTGTDQSARTSAAISLVSQNDDDAIAQFYTDLPPLHNGRLLSYWPGSLALST